MKIGILVSGRGSNMEALIHACQDGRIDGQAVVVISDRAEAGALEIARQLGVEARFMDPKSHDSREAFDRSLVDALKEAGVELVCLAGYMKLVTQAFIDAFAGRIVNIHPSLLPSFPGLCAQQQALEYGCKVTGCTVHLVELAMDSGPILMQATVPILDDDTEQSLSERLLVEEHRLYVEAVSLLASHRFTLEGRRARTDLR